MFKKVRGWPKIYFDEDTINWFILLLIRELMEILLQVLAAYNYNGLNVFNTKQRVLAATAFEVQLFCVLLSMNCFFTGILWQFYCGDHCRETFLKI